MSRFAENTVVSAEKSRQEIERILVRYGATSFAYGWEGANAVIMFVLKARHIRFVLPLPSENQKEFQRDGRGSLRTSESKKRAVEQASRQRWRALALVVKAKLECVESGITSVEDEFLAHIVLPNGETVGRAMKPQIEHAYATGKMPLLLGATT